MISKEDIKKLADLARIDIEDREMEKLGGEVESILGYISQISNFSGSVPPLDRKRVHQLVEGGVINVFREDTNPTESDTYSKELITEFPASKDNYLKVKKIL